MKTDKTATHLVGSFIITATYKQLPPLDAYSTELHADYPAVEATVHIPTDALDECSESGRATKLQVVLFNETIGPRWGIPDCNTRYSSRTFRDETLIASLEAAQSAVSAGIEAMRARVAERAARLASATATNPFADD
jgi:hypothetical protein